MPQGGLLLTMVMKETWSYRFVPREMELKIIKKGGNCSQDGRCETESGCGEGNEEGWRGNERDGKRKRERRDTSEWIRLLFDVVFEGLFAHGLFSRTREIQSFGGMIK